MLCTSTDKILQQPDKLHLLCALALPDFAGPLSLFPISFPFYQSLKNWTAIKYICLNISVLFRIPAQIALPCDDELPVPAPALGTSHVGALVPFTSAKRKLKIFPICQWLRLCTGTGRSCLDIFPLFIFFPL